MINVASIKDSEMKTSLDMVMEFEKAFKRPIKFQPDLSDWKVNQLRVDLIQEELDELKDALIDNDPVAVLDALTDLQYVLDGTYIELGFWKNKHLAFIEVHNSNMSKLVNGEPTYREDGKIMKGENYRPPSLEMFVQS